MSMRQTDLIEKIGNNTEAITGLGELLQEIRAMRECEDCPTWCKNDFLASCIESAIVQLAAYSREHSDELLNGLKESKSVKALKEEKQPTAH